MDFSEALKEPNAKLRDEAIREQIQDASWDDLLEEHLEFGGYADDFDVYDIDIREEGNEIIANVKLSFNESVTSGCKDQNYNRPYLAYFQIVVDKRTDIYVVKNLDTKEDDSTDPSLRPNDDYN